MFDETYTALGRLATVFIAGALLGVLVFDYLELRRAELELLSARIGAVEGKQAADEWADELVSAVDDLDAAVRDGESGQ